MVGNFCTQLAIKLAKEHGVGWVVCKGSNHYGICGFYTLQMAADGLMVSVLKKCYKTKYVFIHQGFVLYKHITMRFSYSVK